MNLKAPLLLIFGTLYCFHFVHGISMELDVNWFLTKLWPKVVDVVNSTIISSNIQISLSKMNLVKDAVTISGFGMGGCFAQQLYLSHSNAFSGLSLYRPHGVYGCETGGDMNAFFQKCVQNKMYNLTELIAKAEGYSKGGLIEPLEKLSKVPLYYHFGTARDEFSVLPYVDTFRFWSKYILNPDLVYAKMLESDFLMPTDDTGGACDTSGMDNYYVGNCNYHVTYTALKYLLGGKVDVTKPSKNLPLQPLRKFSQTDFFNGLTSEETVMAQNGLIYIPFNCQVSGTQCYLHVHFHDVLTSADNNGANNYKDSGLLRIAERNNIVVLFPQAQKTKNIPLDSWDCFGSTGNLHATKNGTQIRIVKRMIDRLIAG